MLLLGQGFFSFIMGIGEGARLYFSTLSAVSLHCPISGRDAKPVWTAHRLAVRQVTPLT